MTEPDIDSLAASITGPSRRRRSMTTKALAATNFGGSERAGTGIRA
jgi:hypothetical protein